MKKTRITIPRGRIAGLIMPPVGTLIEFDNGIIFRVTHVNEGKLRATIEPVKREKTHGAEQRAKSGTEGSTGDCDIPERGRIPDAESIPPGTDPVGPSSDVVP
jgi:hypothetical protein